MLKSNLVGHGFIAPEEILEKEYVFGSQKLPDNILTDKGDWRKFVPIGERQHSRSYDFDTYGCTIYNTIQIIEILERMFFGERNDYSERFVYIGTDTRPPGNNPHVIAEHIRENGLIDDSLLPFDNSIPSFDFYTQPNPLPEEFVKGGKKWISKRYFGHEWVFKDGDPKTKQEILKDALRRSPIGVSVVGWKEYNGIYVKDRGEQDNHWTDLIAYDGDYPIIYDSYEPFIKKLDKNYDFGFAKRYFLRKKSIIKSYLGCIFE